MRAFQVDRVPRPNLDVEFCTWIQSGPFDLEIGAGQGLHAINYCKNNPARRLLAIERTHNKFRGLSHRQSHHDKLSNLFILNADAVSVVSHYLPASCLERVFILYPNPYPKAKQANLRWHNSPFMAQLLSRMTPLSTLHIATNLEWYAKEAVETFQNTWGMRTLSFTPIQPPAIGRTHFEKKYLERAETCFHIILTPEQNQHQASVYQLSGRQ